MNVTKPEMNTALLYWSLTSVARNQSYVFVAIMLASENVNTFYTAWYCMSVIVYNTMATCPRSPTPTDQTPRANLEHTTIRAQSSKGMGS